MTFKKGDKVVCIDNSILSDVHPDFVLELNKIYIVEDDLGEFLVLNIKNISTNIYQCSLWYKHHFVSLNEFRKLKIEDILK